MLKSPDILVPIDFSPCSVNALRVAVGIAAPEGDLTLLHVVDEEFIQAAVAAGMGSSDDLRARLKEQAESNFASMLEGIDTSQLDVEKMIVVGLPFVEILKIARDKQLAAELSANGGQSTPAEELLFGSTAEKVLRGTRVPVLCVPL